MRQFFRGWKRKVGCATLMLACVFAAGWVRSLTIVDWLSFEKYAFISLGGGMTWERVRGPSKRESFFWSTGVENVVDGYNDSTKGNLWKWRCLGFGYNWSESSIVIGPGKISKTEYSYYRWPYWSIVVPLTLLSAYLLLSKPKQPKPFVEQQANS